MKHPVRDPFFLLMLMYYILLKVNIEILSSREQKCTKLWDIFKDSRKLLLLEAREQQIVYSVYIFPPFTFNIRWVWCYEPLMCNVLSASYNVAWCEELFFSSNHHPGSTDTLYNTELFYLIQLLLPNLIMDALRSEEGILPCVIQFSCSVD